MAERMFVVTAGERPHENEIPSQFRGKLKIQRGCADRPSEDLHDRFGSQPDIGNFLLFYKIGRRSTMSDSLGGRNL